MSRRKKGEGSYYDRTINGIKYKQYKFPNGKTIYAKTLKELNEKRKEYESSPESHVINAYYTFGNYCYKWLNQKDNITPKAYDDYETAIKKRVEGYSIADRPIISLTPQMFTQYFKELADKYSKATIDKTWVVLRQVLNYGMENKMIPTFPLKNIQRPKEDDVKVKKKDTEFIDENDMNAVYEECQNPKYGNAANMIILIMYSGMRLSEAINLKWKDVNRDLDKISIKRSSQDIKKRDKNKKVILNEKGMAQYENIEKGTKSSAGNRVVPIPERGMAVLKKLYQIPHKNDDLVFLNANNKKYDRRTIERALSTILKNSKSINKNYSPHALRRGYGSILLSKGVNIAVISKLLGHSNVTTTMNIYTKAFDKDVIDAVNKFNEE